MVVGGEGTPGEQFARRIERGHNAEAFRSHKAVSFDMQLSFATKPVLDATITMLTNSGKVLVTRRSDSARVVFNGTDVLIYPAGAPWPRARFDVLTWAYFFAAPYKLSDPGTRLELLGLHPLEGDSCSAARLTFGTGIGDAPKDWYIVYRDQATDRLRGMAYIVTYGKEFEEANANPHAITYSQYREVDGVPVAGSWEFRDWSMEQGVTGQRGEASISNLRFIDGEVDSLFHLPPGAEHVALSLGSQ